MTCVAINRSLAAQAPSETAYAQSATDAANALGDRAFHPGLLQAITVRRGYDFFN